MLTAERSMQPVLALLIDRALLVRHDLNALAIGSRDAELSMVEDATRELIGEMERAVREADRFIESIA